jgi:hypothetical protein
VRSALYDRAASAGLAAAAAEDDRKAAMLRGKKHAYLEAAQMIEAVESGARIPWNRGWRQRKARS